MRAHIQETIRELSEEIARLQNAITTLRKLEAKHLAVGQNRPHPSPLPQERVRWKRSGWRG
jgi:hypothetical protein